MLARAARRTRALLAGGVALGEHFRQRPGDTVAIQLVREGKSMQVEVRLGGEQIAMP